jgi:lipopolysaccharide export system permease protein
LWAFARSGEISAMRAAGRSTVRVCAPLIFAGVMAAAGSFLLSEIVVPRATIHLKKVETVKIEKSALGKMFFESNWVKGDNSILHFKLLNQAKQRLESVEYFVFDDGVDQIRSFVHARFAQFDATSSVWVLHEAFVTKVNANGTVHGVAFAPTFKTNVESKPPKLLGEGVTSDQIGFFELRELIDEARQGGGALKNLEVELFQKLSLPLANFIFVFFALPFALRRERQTDTYWGVLICLGAAILYWIGNLVMRNLGVNGVVPPALAAWLVTLVLLGGCLWVVRKLDKTL